jgi:hypothetical protein
MPHLTIAPSKWDTRVVEPVDHGRSLSDAQKADAWVSRLPTIAASEQVRCRDPA